MEKRFEKMTAIVTGAGSGIGKYTAERFAFEGANVVLCDINETNVKNTEKELKDKGCECSVQVFDLLDYNAIVNTVKHTVEKYGRIDILANCAGGSADLIKKLSDFKDSTKEVRDWVISLNLNATMDFCQAVTETMIKQNYGKIINITSIAGVCGIKKRADYAAAKAGVVGMTMTLAMELGQYNISVNCVSPGAIMRGEENIKCGHGDSVGMTYIGADGRMGTPMEVANLVAFLASHEGDFITGQNYIIDGGRWLGPKAF